MRMFLHPATARAASRTALVLAGCMMLASCSHSSSSPDLQASPDPQASASSATFATPDPAATMTPAAALPTPGNLPTPSPQDIVLREDAISPEFGFYVPHLQTVCLADSPTSMICVSDDATWGQACGNGRPGAMYMTDGSSTVACADGDIASLGSQLPELSDGEQARLAEDSMVCDHATGTLTCADMASGHGFVLTRQTYTFF